MRAGIKLVGAVMSTISWLALVTIAFDDPVENFVAFCCGYVDH